jgi:D-alanyl-D-alanine carboxypeptidase (penicillin-binding protein 5/6)
VTCKSWAVGDVATRELAGGHEADVLRDIASTTKIMTAVVVLRQAEQEPGLLDEVLTVSPAADDTPGSTAGVRAGERVRVGDLLFGLMLPSGNDAATALAEFVGPRVSANDAQRAPQERFLQAMNRTAGELGLSNTQYRNPHGLTHPEHKSTARDQFRLACAALATPGFRPLIVTRQFAARLQGPGGYERIAVWRNTNRLLDIDGYAGVKTGTTEAAGACLVSLRVRNDREAVAVVLGSTSSDARYVDTRNLFRWYWQQLGK